MKQMRIKKDILPLTPGVTFAMLEYAIRRNYVLTIIDEGENGYIDDEGCGKWSKDLVEEIENAD